MRNILLVARREYLEQIRGRAFRVTTILLPAIFAVIFGVGYFSTRILGTDKHLAVASNDPVLAAKVRTELTTDKDARTTVEIIAPATAADRAALIKRIQSKALDGFVWIEAAPDSIPTATYTSPSSGDFVTGSRLRSAINHALVSERLTATGTLQAQADTLIKGVEIATFQVKKDGRVVKSNAQASFWKGIRDGLAVVDDHGNLRHERSSLHHPGENLSHL